MSSEAQEAAKAVDAFYARLSDGAAVAAQLAEDALIFESAMRNGLVGGDTAWIVSESRAAGMYKDKPVDRVTTETKILRKIIEGWRIAHIRWSSCAATSLPAKVRRHQGRRP